jgi:hypothetical protein
MMTSITLHQPSYSCQIAKVARVSRSVIVASLARQRQSISWSRISPPSARWVHGCKWEMSASTATTSGACTKALLSATPSHAKVKLYSLWRAAYFPPTMHLPGRGIRLLRSRFPFIGTAEAPKVPPSPMPAAATAARMYIYILDILFFVWLGRCQAVHRDFP